MHNREYAEDLDANLQLVRELAPVHCTECGGYHLARAHKRLTAPDALDRPEMILAVRDRLALHEAPGPFEILIAGCADSNLVATAAEAVSMAIPAHYTVLDHCRTPLAVCEAYANRHGLMLQTKQVDMGAPAGTFAADVIVVHSLLRFIPPLQHLATMHALRRWLKPGGAMIFSHRLIEGTSEPFYRAEYSTSEPILALFAEAGLRVVSLEQYREEDGPRQRLLAVLEGD